MKVTENLTITKRSSDGAFYGEKNGSPYVIEVGNSNYSAYDGFYTVMRATEYKARPALYEQLVKDNKYPSIFGTYTPESAPIRSTKELLIEGIQKLMNFFTEFSFTPSFRFTNTFAFMCCKGQKDARTYVKNYFALMDSSYQKEVVEKIKSAEFTDFFAVF